MSDADDMAARSKQVAKHLLDALDQDPDPARAVAAEAKERDDAAQLETFYVQTGQKPRRARTTIEMKFAAGLVPCPKCGTRDLGAMKYQTDDNIVWTLSCRCPRCNAPRSFPFTSVDTSDRAPAAYELGDGPSLQLLPAEFRAELDGVTPQLRERPEQLAPAEWRDAERALTQALICVHELVKLTRAGADRDRLVAERDRLLALADRFGADADRVWKLEHPHTPRGELSATTVRAHQAWVAAGRSGPGRLELEHVAATEARVGAADLRGARLVDVDLSRAVADGAQLDDAELRDVKFVGAGLDGASFKGARVVGGSFARARMSIAKFHRAVVDGTDFTKSDIERSVWDAARVERATFVGARFGEGAITSAKFAHCDLHDASFAVLVGGTPPSTRGTKFEDCDLRGTDWRGRDVDGATFVRCKLAGAHGAAHGTAGVTVIDCDLSRDDAIRALGAPA
jgi:uncharacterized protein YjbI with pentapeptide repeats